MTLAPAGPFARDTEHPNLLVTRHPLLQHKVSLLRSVDTPKKLFKELVDEIAQLLAYEVTADLATRPRIVETPLETMEGARVDGANIVVVPVLRAGLGMVEGILRLIPTARVGHIGLQRDHDTLEPADYYFKVPPGVENSLHIVTDPMLATGGSASAAVAFLKGTRREVDPADGDRGRARGRPADVRTTIPTCPSTRRPSTGSSTMRATSCPVSGTRRPTVRYGVSGPGITRAPRVDKLHI